ncbi:MAG: prepilin-type N-terminal cleavage/methylation domain-containing protein [Patescibacteria group bacterium]
MHKKCIWHRNIWGFNLIELIVVIAVAAVIMTTVLLNENPEQRIGKARDAERQQALESLARAIELYEIENGSLPDDFSTSTLGMGEKFVLCSTNGTVTCDGMTRGCLVVDDQAFLNKIGALPIDPTKSSAADTGYYISRTDNDKLELGACEVYQTSSEISMAVKATLPPYVPPPAPAACGDGVLNAGEACDYDPDGSTCVYNANYYTSGIVYDDEVCTGAVAGCSYSCSACLEYCSAGGGGKYSPREVGGGGE